MNGKSFFLPTTLPHDRETIWGRKIEARFYDSGRMLLLQLGDAKTFRRGDGMSFRSVPISLCVGPKSGDVQETTNTRYLILTSEEMIEADSLGVGINKHGQVMDAHSYMTFNLDALWNNTWCAVLIPHKVLYREECGTEKFAFPLFEEMAVFQDLQVGFVVVGKVSMDLLQKSRLAGYSLMHTLGETMRCDGMKLGEWSAKGDFKFNPFWGYSFNHWPKEITCENKLITLFCKENGIPINVVYEKVIGTKLYGL